MLSLRLALVAATALVARVAAASDYFIDPPSVPLSTRRNWCTSETTQCPLICLDTGSSGKPRDNSCDPATLVYACVCGNGNSPNLTEYSLTMPYSKCTQFQVNCVAACGAADNQCSENCRTSIVCGAAKPKGASTSSASGTGVSAATSTSASPNTIQTGFDGQGASTPGNSGAGPSMAAPLSLGVAITALLVAPFMML